MSFFICTLPVLVQMSASGAPFLVAEKISTVTDDYNSLMTSRLWPG
ncbi:hypothetical protein [Cupriavidus basilensis]|uniref:Uncharacterized protein n=1 Tax=Cupriavidus basilensis TaxID=68895 RepID=A0A7M2GZQ0_9BURK|nr:hypothetical protein [Cupriavidus basilensis]QOT77352.1 hypothetical protein F7R26_004595 [Cupriavidus basilensis]